MCKKVIKSIPINRLRKELAESTLNNSGSNCICCGEELSIVESSERSDLCIICTMKLHHIPTRNPTAIADVDSIIYITGTIDNFKAKLKVFRDILEVSISTYIGIGRAQVYEFNLADVVILKSLKFGVQFNRIMIIQFANLGKKNGITEIIFKYEQEQQYEIDKLMNSIKIHMREYKVTCKQCGLCHFYNNDDLLKAYNIFMTNLSKMQIAGTAPLNYISDRQLLEFLKCKKCGSRNTVYEEIDQNNQGDISSDTESITRKYI